MVSIIKCFHEISVGPLDVKLVAANQPLSASRRYDLLCKTSGSRPPATVTWWQNGQRLEGSKETVRYWLFFFNHGTSLKVKQFEPP